jgi:toxin ParE1/3/4
VKSKAPAQRTLALGFVDALERAYAHISKHPRTGSPRYAHELVIPDLRSWPLSKYPYLVFYVEHADPIDVWRVLHMKGDISAWMADDAADR